MQPADVNNICTSPSIALSLSDSLPFHGRFAIKESRKNSTHWQTPFNWYKTRKESLGDLLSSLIAMFVQTLFSSYSRTGFTRKSTLNKLAATALDGSTADVDYLITER